MVRGTLKVIYSQANRSAMPLELQCISEVYLRLSVDAKSFTDKRIDLKSVHFLSLLRSDRCMKISQIISRCLCAIEKINPSLLVATDHSM